MFLQLLVWVHSSATGHQTKSIHTHVWMALLSPQLPILGPSSRCVKSSRNDHGLIWQSIARTRLLENYPSGHQQHNLPDIPATCTSGRCPCRKEHPAASPQEPEGHGPRCSCSTRPCNLAKAPEDTIACNKTGELPWNSQQVNCIGQVCAVQQRGCSKSFFVSGKTTAIHLKIHSYRFYIQTLPLALADVALHGAALPVALRHAGLRGRERRGRVPAEGTPDVGVGSVSEELDHGGAQHLTQDLEHRAAFGRAAPGVQVSEWLGTSLTSEVDVLGTPIFLTTTWNCRGL